VGCFECSNRSIQERLWNYWFGGKPIRLDKEANRGSERKLSKMGSFAVFLFHPFEGISAPIVAVAVSANAIIW
jgi:hypothetical protein